MTEKTKAKIETMAKKRIQELEKALASEKRLVNCWFNKWRDEYEKIKMTELPKKHRECTTHHHACDCREAYFSELKDDLFLAMEALEIANDSILLCSEKHGKYEFEIKKTLTTLRQKYNDQETEGSRNVKP